MLNRKLWLVAFSLLLSVSVIFAQDECPTLVADALSATDSACTGIGRNEACYGNVQITAQLGDPELTFERQGDIVQLTEVERLTLSPYVDGSDEWGVALMSVQANLPETLPGQNVTFLLFGDVDISNAGDAMEAFYFSSGVGTAGCNEANSGIIINTPEGAGTVSLVANDVAITLGSTAVLTAEPADMMTIALTEGDASVSFDGVTQEFEGGFQVQVPINEDLEAIGAPTEPEPIPEDTTETLPDIMEFTPEEDGDDDDGDSTDTGEVAAGNIVPLSGTWTFTIDTITVSEGCPPGMGDATTSAPIPSSTIEFGDTFDLQAFMESTGDIGMDVIYGNPETNVYTMAMSQEGVSLNWTMTLVSDSLMTGEYSVDMSSLGLACILGITYNVALQG